MKETLNFNCEKFKGRVNQKLHKMFFASFSILVKRYFKNVLNQEFKILPCQVKLEGPEKAAKVDCAWPCQKPTSSFDPFPTTLSSFRRN